MTRLSVNINKIATLRNARGGNNPDVQRVAQDCERFGAQGITVHPRPDQRHIRYQDVRDLRPLLTTEFNIEGNPISEFIALVLENRPTQVTLVPDGHDQITSNHGWDTRTHLNFLTDVTARFHEAGIRVSIFVNADEDMVDYAARAGADRVELYTEPYAAAYPVTVPEGSPEGERLRAAAIEPFIRAAEAARSLGLGLNAGHDLSLQNLAYFHRQIPWTDEVSIGHALICDALYLGLEETIQRYLEQLETLPSPSLVGREWSPNK
ncbi:MAG: pyridoxine 5'-phosphate synthase [Bacteroidaceae bacterium]|nr:pyridoxine 5'-phosphate synthase [Bacteroidaceae bacterium]